MFGNTVFVITVLASNMIVMILEIITPRIFSPYIGGSILTWSLTIGVFLICMSLGSWKGGELASKHVQKGGIGMLLYSAGVWIGLIAISKDFILGNASLVISDVSLFVWLVLIIFFGPPITILSMITPYVARFWETKSERSRLVGNLSALSSLGAISGTFSAIYILLPYLSLTIILNVSAITLVSISFFFLRQSIPKKLLFYLVAVILLLVLGMYFVQHGVWIRSDRKMIVDVNSAYSRIQIIDVKTKSGRTIRSLITSPGAIQSAQYRDNPSELIFPYLQMFGSAQSIKNDIASVLIIGQGGNVLSNHILKTWNVKEVTVVEIDPMIVALSSRYFYSDNDPRLTVHIQDGRRFLKESTKKFDVIFIDAFKDLAPPFELVTREAVSKISEHLNEGGVVMMNILSATSGPESEIVHDEYRTYASLFPSVSVYVAGTSNTTKPKTHVIVASHLKNVKPLKKSVLAKESGNYNDVTEQIRLKEGRILRDDFAPIEFMTRNFSLAH